MLFLAEMPAVIGPQDNHSVLSMGAGIERLQHHSNTVIDKLGAGQVRRDGFAPVTRRKHRFMAERCIMHVLCNLQTGWR